MSSGLVEGGGGGGGGEGGGGGVEDGNVGDGLVVRGSGNVCNCCNKKWKTSLL